VSAWSFRCVHDAVYMLTGWILMTLLVSSLTWACSNGKCELLVEQRNAILQRYAVLRRDRVAEHGTYQLLIQPDLLCEIFRLCSD
jgi:hypothetical protein